MNSLILRTLSLFSKKHRQWERARETHFSANRFCSRFSANAKKSSISSFDGIFAGGWFFVAAGKSIPSESTQSELDGVASLLNRKKKKKQQLKEVRIERLRNVCFGFEFEQFERERDKWTWICCCCCLCTLLSQRFRNSWPEMHIQEA